MVAYSFKKQFRAPILAGTKRQTIRAERKRHARPGEELQLYTGMRTRHCQLLGRPICELVLPVRLSFEAGDVELGDGRTLWRGWELDAFACSDGFEGWDHMKWFWKREHPEAPVFSGVLILWQPFVAMAEAA